MNEWLVLAAIILAGASGVLVLPLGIKRGSDWSFAGLMATSAMLGLASSGRVLLGYGGQPLQLRWQVPAAVFRVHVDALSALFLLSIFLLGALGAWYGIDYYAASSHGRRAVRLRVYYGLVVAGMALLVIAQNSILFLVGWELMALSAFMALTIEDHKAEVREAGLIYLIATRLGTLAIIAAFALLHAMSNSYSLALQGLPANTPLASAVFGTALLGFGLKAGVMPLHVWLPAAHANAPSHVSAVMSGVLIKMGVYGLLRVTSFFRDIPLWWGGTILGLAIVSSVLGVAFALGQHDIKRLLAYHSVENIGIITLGIALGLIGRATGQPYLVTMGFAGALLHVINHGLFKALLFLGAGSVITATGTRNLEQYGGLIRAMPRTALAFLVGAVAISGLPPLNGFVSELFIYLGMLEAQALPLGNSAIALAFAVAVLAMVGALALACFAKVFSVTFLGEPRSVAANCAKEGSWAISGPMALLASLCMIIGVGPHVALALMRRVATTLDPTAASHVPNLFAVSRVHLALLLFVFVFLLTFRKHRHHTGPTWDCGFAAPTARMQYTASSIAADLVSLFAVFLRPKSKCVPVVGALPKPGAYESHVPEVVLDLCILPVLRGFARGVSYLRFMQRGAAHLYLFYVLVTLLIMLAVFR